MTEVEQWRCPSCGSTEVHTKLHARACAVQKEIAETVPRSDKSLTAMTVAELVHTMSFAAGDWDLADYMEREDDSIEARERFDAVMGELRRRGLVHEENDVELG